MICPFCLAQLAGMEDELERLPQRCLLAAAFLTYLPNQPEDIRGIFVQRWCEMLGLREFQLCSFLSTEKEMLTWRFQGLPADPLSLENAVVLLQVCAKWSTSLMFILMLTFLEMGVL